MAKRKQSKKTASKGANVEAPRGKPTTSKRQAKSPTLSLSAAVKAQFEKTLRRIKEIEKRALAKLRGNDTDK